MIIELGRLTQDVKLMNITVDGAEQKVLNNRLAIGIGKDNAVFIDVSAWGATAEFMARHFTKGSEIYLVGEIRNRQMKNKDDEAKPFTVPYIKINSIKFTHGKKDGDEMAVIN